MTTARLAFILKLAAIGVGGAVGAAQAMSPGPLTVKDVVTICGGVLVAILGYLHPSPSESAQRAPGPMG